MNKFPFASMAILCLMLSSCSTQEFDISESFEDEITQQERHETTSRSANILSVSFTDTSGSSQSVSCEEARLTYITRTTIELFIKYTDGTTQTELGNDIIIVPNSGDLKVTTDSSNTFTTSDLDIETCMPECCYTYNNGNSAGTALSFIVEEEATGF